MSKKRSRSKAPPPPSGRKVEENEVFALYEFPSLFDAMKAIAKATAREKR